MYTNDTRHGFLVERRFTSRLKVCYRGFGEFFLILGEGQLFLLFIFYLNMLNKEGGFLSDSDLNPYFSCKLPLKTELFQVVSYFSQLWIKTYAKN